MAFNDPYSMMYGPDQPSHPPGTMVRGRPKLMHAFSKELSMGALVLATTFDPDAMVKHGCILLTAAGRITRFGARYLRRA